MDIEKERDKNMLSLYGPRFVCLFLSQHVHSSLFCGSCECWVTLRSFRCVLNSSSYLPLQMNTLLGKSLPLLPLLSTVSFNFKTKHCRGASRGIISSRIVVLNSPSCIPLRENLQFISSLSPCCDLKETFRWADDRKGQPYQNFKWVSKGNTIKCSVYSHFHNRIE